MMTLGIMLFSMFIIFFGLVSDSSSLNEMSSVSDTNSSLSDKSILSIKSSFLPGSSEMNNFVFGIKENYILDGQGEECN